MTIRWAQRNRRAIASTPELLSGPYVRDRNPDRNATGVDPATNVLLTVAVGLPRTIVLSTVVITFSINGAAPITVYTSSAFQAGYSGTATHNASALEDYFDFVIDPSSNFPSNGVVTVRVLAQDDAAGSITPPEVYSFSLAFASPSPGPPPFAGIRPPEATIREGVDCTVFSNTALVDTTQDFNLRQAAVPASLSVAVAAAGTGRADGGGVLLSSGAIVNGSAALSTTASYKAFDAQLDVQVVAPGTSPNAAVELADFEFRLDGSNFARVRLRFDPTRNVAQATVDAVVQVAGVPMSGGAGGSFYVDVANQSTVTLRIVRYLQYLFMFANDTQVFMTNRFSASTSAGLLRTTTTNGAGQTINVITRVLEMRVRTHTLFLCTSGPYLLANKRDASRRRVLGNSPIVQLADLGAHDVIIFGPWGSVTVTNGFTFTLPEGRTLGTSFAVTVSAYDDAQLRDKS